MILLQPAMLTTENGSYSGGNRRGYHPSAGREKRGMTIDLGYAYWPQDDDTVIGFVDVRAMKSFSAICWRVSAGSAISC